MISALLIVGCAEEAAAPPPERPVEGCTSDAVCPTGLRCAEGACVGEAAPNAPLWLRVLPPRDDPVAAVEIGPIAFADVPVFQLDDALVLPESVDIEGRVAHESTPGSRVAVQVTARPVTGLEAGTRLTYSAESVSLPGDVRFRLALTPWWPTVDGSSPPLIRYVIRLVPDPTALPPWESIEPAPLTDEARQYNLPAESRLAVVRGSVVGDFPLQNLRVRAVNASGARVSSESVTDLEGQFTVRFWPSDTPRTVQLLIGSTAAEQPLPDLVVSVELPPEGADPLPPVLVRLDDIGTTQMRRGRVVERDSVGDRPVAGARLRFRGTVGAGTFNASALTDADGQFAARLYAGEYVVDVEPPVATGLRLARRLIELGADSNADDIEFALRPRTLSSGRVVDPAGEPLIRGRIEARLVRARYGDARLESPDDTPPVREHEAALDDQGAFEFELDPGDHVLSVTPTSDSGLPVVEHLITVPAAQTSAVKIGEIAVPPAAAIRVTLHDERGNPVDGATVEAWWRGEGDVAARLAGAATSDKAGDVRLAVPTPR